jgi:putative endopeptidase
MLSKPLTAFAFILLGSAASAQNSSFDVSVLDRSAKPCQDFFQFACGGWIKANPIPADHGGWNRFNEVDERNRATLHSILDKAKADDPKRSANDRLAGDFYAACMDEAGAEAKGLEPLRADLERIAALKSLDELAPLVARLHTTGTSAFFGFGALEDFKDARQTIGIADQGGLGLPERDYYFKDDAASKETRAAYVAHVGRILELAGMPKADAAADAQRVMEFETALAKASQGVVERRDLTKLDHKLSVAELQALTPVFSWKGYFQSLGAPPITRLNVTVPDFFTSLGALLKATPLPTVRTYLRWHTLHDAAPWLPEAFAAETFEFYDKRLTGAQERRPRWKRCVDLTDANVGDALGQAFADLTFGEQGQRRMVKLVADLRQSLVQDVHELTWMSEATKKEALTKLGTMALKVGVPAKWKEYRGLVVARGELLGNLQRAQLFEVKRQLAKIDKPTDRAEFGYTVPTVNAGYNPLKNDITFPAGILQPPFFDRNADDGLNYGAVGAVIGHEITHGFDDEGRKFDADGNSRDWWTKSDAEQFEQRAQCIDDQYSGFTAIEEVKVNGKLTLGENTADNGGVRLAYRALKLAQAGKEPALIDGFTADQRFFLGWAGIWCGERRPPLERLLAQVDPHAPTKTRVNGVVTNLTEFREAFQCQAGDPMVRETQCRVW